MSKPRWFQALTEEEFDGFCKTHSCGSCKKHSCGFRKEHSRGFRKNIFRFESCDVVCQDGLDPYHIQPHVQVTTLFDVNAIPTEQISKFFDCFQIQNSGYHGDEELVALRPWRDCVRSTDGCHRHIHTLNSKFCSFTCKIEHVLEHEGDLSSIYKSWPGDKLKEESEHVGDLSIHPCGDPEKIYPFKKRSRRRIEFYDDYEFELAFAYRPLNELDHEMRALR